MKKGGCFKMRHRIINLLTLTSQLEDAAEAVGEVIVDFAGGSLKLDEWAADGVFHVPVEINHFAEQVNPVSKLRKLGLQGFFVVAGQDQDQVEAAQQFAADKLRAVSDGIQSPLTHHFQHFGGGSLPLNRPGAGGFDAPGIGGVGDFGAQHNIRHRRAVEVSGADEEGGVRCGICCHGFD